MSAPVLDLCFCGDGYATAAGCCWRCAETPVAAMPCELAYEFPADALNVAWLASADVPLPAPPRVPTRVWCPERDTVRPGAAP